MWDFESDGYIDFVGAGRQGTTYSERVNTFDWKRFYDLGGARMLSAAKAQLLRRYQPLMIERRLNQQQRPIDAKFVVLGRAFEIDEILFGFCDALETVQQKVRVRIFGIVELYFPGLRAILPAKRLITGFGDLQAAFERALKVVELSGQFEN